MAKVLPTTLSSLPGNVLPWPRRTMPIKMLSSRYAVTAEPQKLCKLRSEYYFFFNVLKYPGELYLQSCQDVEVVEAEMKDFCFNRSQPGSWKPHLGKLSLSFTNYERIRRNSFFATSSSASSTRKYAKSNSAKNYFFHLSVRLSRNWLMKTLCFVKPWPETHLYLSSLTATE
jgi:hypothetical protein